MNQIYSFFAEGLPRPQPRPRLSRTGRVYNPPSADEWRDAVSLFFLKQRTGSITGPVAVEVEFRLPTSKKSGEGFPAIGKPDLDNLLKSVLDALTAAGAWEDDGQVCSVYTSKIHTNAKPGAYITIRDLTIGKTDLKPARKESV
jgi:Holliday junction resolvase RusA-like endonuclease